VVTCYDQLINLFQRNSLALSVWSPGIFQRFSILEINFRNYVVLITWEGKWRLPMAEFLNKQLIVQNFMKWNVYISFIIQDIKPRNVVQWDI